jgi:hypothetical protein
MTSKHLENHQENPHNKPSSKKANIAKTVAAAALITIAGAANGQNAATIDPKYYSMTNPYELPNLSDKSVMNLNIKTGQVIPMGMPYMDTGSSIILTPDGRTIT